MGSPDDTLLLEAVTCHRAGRPAEAAALYRRLLAACPGHAAARHNLGVLLFQTGRVEEGLAELAAALASDSGPEAHWLTLIEALGGCGRIEEALALLRRGLARGLKGPALEGVVTRLRGTVATLGNALYAAAVAHQQAERLDEAEALYRRLLDLDPCNPGCHHHLGLIAHKRDRSDEAASAIRRALALEPADADALNNLGIMFYSLGRAEEAAACYRKALTLKPDNASVLGNLLLVMHYSDAFSKNMTIAAARRYNELIHSAATIPAYSNDRTPLRRLRIGYVSGDFRQHPVGFLLLSALECHDKSVVEIFCYSNGRIADALTARLQACADHWRTVVAASDDEAAAMIRQDGIDILVDLSGHNGQNRLPVFARHPAPVQLSWLGYWGTTGLSAIDAVLMDTATVLPGEEDGFTEAVIRLPGGRFCYTAPDYAPAVASPPLLRNGFVTFGSFNNLAKVTPAVFALWARILVGVAHSRLVLKWKNLRSERECARVAAQFAAAGGDVSRLELRGPSSHPEMLAEYGDIDIALDPFPFSGGITSYEAVWMGVPVVTLPGRQPVSRQTLGLLVALGLDAALAASSAGAYVKIATGLAAAPEQLAGWRAGLRERMRTSPACDGVRMARALEAAFRERWVEWCAQSRPRKFGQGDSGNPNWCG